MFLREVVTGQRTKKPLRYAQIVEAFRNEDGKSRHHILLSLGRVDQLDKVQVRRLVIALSRYLDTGEVPEGGRVGEVRDFGLIYLADQLWKRLELPAFFRKQLGRRKYDIPVERALFAMVAHRLVDPSSKLACWDWLQHDAFLPDARGLKLQHLYRAMDFLDECHEKLEEALYLHRRSLFDQAKLVYYDTTSTYFECDDPSDEPEQYGLRQKGHSKDLRFGSRQIVVGLAVDQQGLPIASDVFSGETSDQVTVVPMLDRLRKLGLREVCWVADRGMTSDKNLASVRAAGLHYIVGVRLRAANDLRSAILANGAPYVKAAEGLQVKEVRLRDKRYVICFSPESAQRDLKLRTGAIERLAPVLKNVNDGGNAAAITEHGLYRRFVSKGEDGFHLDKAKLEREAQCDGTFVLEVSDFKMTPAAAALAYKGLLRVEQSFRVLKHGVDVRPVYHRLDHRIRSHVTLCMLGLFLERIVELEHKVPFEHVRVALRRIRAVELTFHEQKVWETSNPSPQARQVFADLKVPMPPAMLPGAPS